MKLSSFFTRIVIALALLPSMAAAQTTIDGSNQESTTASLQAMRSELSPQQNCRLTIAITRIRIGDTRQAAREAGGAAVDESPLGPLLHGLDYNEILALADTYPESVRSSCGA